MKDNHVLGKYTAPAAPVQGHTEAEGYAESIRQMVKWIKDGDIAEIGDIDTDELLAAANLIIRSYQRIDELETALRFVLECLEIACVQRGIDITSPTPESAIGRGRAALLEPFPAESGAHSA